MSQLPRAQINIFNVFVQNQTKKDIQVIIIEDEENHQIFTSEKSEAMLYHMILQLGRTVCKACKILVNLSIRIIAN